MIKCPYCLEISNCPHHEPRILNRSACKYQKSDSCLNPTIVKLTLDSKVCVVEVF